MIEETKPFSLEDSYLEDSEKRDVRLQESVRNARSRHSDWDETIRNHKWSDVENNAIAEHDGDVAELGYLIAKARVDDPLAYALGEENHPYPDAGPRTVDDGRKEIVDHSKLATLDDVLKD